MREYPKGKIAKKSVNSVCIVKSLNQGVDL